MAIKVSGIVVIDDNKNLNVGIVTATSLDIDPLPITFSPADASSDVSLSSNIVITYNASIAKGSGNITLREGSASGTVIETIAVSSGSVTLSAAQVTINPSDFPTGKDIYVVIDEGAFVQSNTELGGTSPLLNTYNFSTGPITASSFSPNDGATGQSVSTNINITFSENISKGSGNITLRAGSASGTVRQTIDVTSGAVSVSGNQATINPPSDLQHEEDTYVVVDAGCFRNSDGDVASGNAIINTYNFTLESDILGTSMEGGYLICAASSIYWIVSPRNSEVSRNWYQRSDGATRAQQVSGCSGWFVPNCSQFKNPGYECRTYWDNYTCYDGTYWDFYWTDNELGSGGVHARLFGMLTASNTIHYKNCLFCARAFRCVSY